MAGRVRGASWRAAVLAIVAIGVVTFGGSALAGHVESGVKSYTGCLVPKDGVIIKVKEGNNPAGPCTAGMTEVHLSGGDITRISGGPGVTVSPASSTTQNGHVTINLDPKYSLPQSCTNGQVAKWQSSTTSWVCAADNDTTYSAGTGLDLSSGNAFSIEPGYRVPGKSCPSGEFSSGFDSSGAIICSAPSSAPLSFYKTQTPSTITVVDNYTDHDIVRLDLPAGKYALSSSGTVQADTRDGWSDGDCSLTGPNGALYDTQDFADDDAHTSAAAVSLSTVALNGIATLSAAASVAVQCKAFSVTDQALAKRFEIVAVAVR